MARSAPDMESVGTVSPSGGTMESRGGSELIIEQGKTSIADSVVA